MEEGHGEEETKKELTIGEVETVNRLSMFWTVLALQTGTKCPTIRRKSLHEIVVHKINTIMNPKIGSRGTKKVLFMITMRRRKIASL